MMGKKSLTTLVAIFVILLTSCAQTQEEGSRAEVSTSSRVNWSEKDSLREPLRALLSANCQNFVAESSSIEFIRDYPDFNARTFGVNSAILFLYLDGAVSPEIEDENSTDTYYEEWKCKEDTLYLDELRFSNADFNGLENPVYVSDCGYGVEKQPTTITLTCADGGIRIESITWQSWNTVEASGSGTLLENTCNPDCSTGNYVSQDASITLGLIKKDKSGNSVFSEVSITTDKKQQSGGYVDTYSLYFGE
jgi:hypothetical protein